MTTVTSNMFAELVGEVIAPDPKWLKQARSRLDKLTKPLGSLGRLEDIAARFIAIRDGEIDKPLKKAAYVFAADHGVVAEGVSAYPKEVTRQMVLNFLQQGAAINVLASLHDVDLTIVDVGVDADFGDLPGLLQRKVRSGTRNMLHEPAMTEEEMLQSLLVGLELATGAHEKGQTLVAVGEMGIGNTTSASAITAVLTRQAPAAVTGKGAGLEKSAQEHKIRVVDAILRTHFGKNAYASAAPPLEVLRCVGGLEIAAMVGLVLGAARYRIPIVTDGFISTAAAALVYALEPRVREYLFAGIIRKSPAIVFCWSI